MKRTGNNILQSSNPTMKKTMKNPMDKTMNKTIDEAMNETSILDVCKDVMGYMMFEFLNPKEIGMCLLSHPIFHALSDRQLRLTRKLSKITLSTAVQSHDHELFEYCFKFHNLKHKNPLCFRLDLILFTCVEVANIKVFTYLFETYNLNLDKDIVGRLLIECCGPYTTNGKCIIFNMLMKWIKQNEIDFNILNINILPRDTFKVNVKAETLQQCVRCDRVELLQIYKDEYGINVPISYRLYASSDKMRNYIQQNGV